jgi:hypothetical protein
MDDIQGFINNIKSPALRAVAEHWHQARGGRLMPKWTDLSSSVLASHFKLLWGFQYDPKTQQFTGGLTGEHVKQWVGAGFTGARLLDLQPPAIAKEAQGLLTKIVTTPLAMRSSGRLFTVGNYTVTGERVALPLSAMGTVGDGILGASDYDSPVLSGPIELIYENLEWCAL